MPSSYVPPLRGRRQPAYQEACRPAAEAKAGRLEQRGETMAKPALVATDTLLVFDLDNTLVHSRINFRAIREAIIAGLRRVEATDEPPEALVRRAIPELMLLAEAHDARHGTVLAAGLWRTVLEYETAGMEDATIEEGAGEVLARLRERGHPLAVLTNNARKAALEALERFALMRHVERIFARDDVTALKPHPDGVRRAMAAFDGRVARTLVIGDSWIDGMAAREAGAAFLAFQPRPNDLESHGLQPVAVVRALRELEALDLPLLAANAPPRHDER
jgi:phosphoglycolate phosphatase